jgi:hypothetical protein
VKQMDEGKVMESRAFQLFCSYRCGARSRGTVKLSWVLVPRRSHIIAVVGSMQACSATLGKFHNYYWTPRSHLSAPEATSAGVPKKLQPLSLMAKF